MLNQSEKKIPILMYHSVSCSPSRRFKQFTVSPVEFTEQIAFLYHHHYTPITVTQLINARSNRSFILPERPIVLTFDDGFADFWTDALPVLRKYGFTATLYIPTAYINSTSQWLQQVGERTRPMLTWEQLAEISKSGIECGAHSHSHTKLDTLPHSLARNEILHSKIVLEDYLSKEIFCFAYPYGYSTARIRQMVLEAGFTSACAVRHAMSQVTDDPFSLARLMVRTHTSMLEYAALLMGRTLSPSTTLYQLYARARTPMWQLVRRCAASITLHLQERELA
jgi:peptidoglycan/xylan/chitin deacetylase (PgdA/CDA1 family)